jgi:hypothetical protein
MAFAPPPASATQVTGVPFDLAANFAPTAKERYDEADRKPGNQDPSKCKALLRFPDIGSIKGPIFWSSKMAIDADGPAAGPNRLTGKQMDPASGQNETTLRLANGDSIPSETVPYIVLPLAPHSTKAFDSALAIGDVAIVVFGNKLTAAVCGDLGPAAKIGEASIRVHEALQQHGCPDPCASRDGNGFCKHVRNASVGEDVLFFVFPDSAFPKSELTIENIDTKVQERALALYAKLRGRG